MRFFYLTVLLILGFEQYTQAQEMDIDSLLKSITCDCDENGGIDPVLIKVAEPAQFIGGDSLFRAYLSKELAPTLTANDMNRHIIEITFSIDTIGKVKLPINMMWKTSVGNRLNTAIRKAILNMPLWQPKVALSSNRRRDSFHALIMVLYGKNVAIDYRDHIWK
ncbi:hypothetical protein [Chitinophaga nivalis]|uniref:TonB C-terminal domain-containing protein n=1 Tax=Chitinophaga nivalis TaxID=2991709 RepID=A0ABT3IRX0_9BACT|nr:hypothetical protein [Chitinophaga nivalis]MCW3463674.1 hypothetical protein [Chitinophaga nivalis]MCW3486636.1 hypothetical protein [Chitinophaga nivalis]